MPALNPRVFDQEPGDKRRIGLEWTCPKNGARCWAPFKSWPIREPKWEWDGNRETPTVKPSINCGGCCHFTLTKGKVVIASDSEFKPSA